MSGRGRLSRHTIDPRRLHYPYHHQPQGPYTRGPGPTLPSRTHSPGLHEHLAMLELDLERRTAELRVLESERRLIDTESLDRQRQLAELQEELRRKRIVVSDIKSGRDKYIGDLIEKARRLDAELRDFDFLREEVPAIRADIERQTKTRMELGARIEMLKKEISIARSENKKIPALREELDDVSQQLARTRNAGEIEKKANMEMVEQKISMEKNMVQMSREIEKLRADLENSGGRPWAPPPVGGTYGSNVGTAQAQYTPSYPQLGNSVRGSMYGSGSNHNRHSYR